MKLVINIVLTLAILLLAYMLYSSIKEPIAFGEAKKLRKDAVVDKLQEIRKSQEIYRLIKGEFAGSFDQLSSVLNNDSIPTVKLVEDPEDPSNPEKFQKIITYSSAKDSLRGLGIGNIDSLQYIPFTDGLSFDIAADTLTYQQTLVSVTEVGTKWANFMGKYASPQYAKYDAGYEPHMDSLTPVCSCILAPITKMCFTMRLSSPP